MKPFVLLTLAMCLLVACLHNNNETVFNPDSEENNSDLSFWKEDSTQITLWRCHIIKHIDSIVLNFSYTNKHSYGYEIRVLKVAEKISADMYLSYSILDSSYKPPVFTTLKQEIVFDKKEYETGDSIKGNVSLVILERWNTGVDTIKIKGGFRAIVH